MQKRAPWQKSDLQDYLWQSLQLFNLYRLLLVIGFVSLTKFNLDTQFFGVVDKKLYQQACAIYGTASLIILMCSVLIKRRYALQANIPIFIDVVALIVLMHATGGIISGVGILLIVIVAAHSLLFPGKYSLLSAAIAAILLFSEHSYNFLSQKVAINMYTQVGLLGFAIFITSLVTNLLSLRVRRSQLIVESQAQQLATSQQLNAHIISAMHAGVLVFDRHFNIRLINVAARMLLDFQATMHNNTLYDLPLSFQESFAAWQNDAKNTTLLSSQSGRPALRLSFHPLGKGLPSGTLVFLYDLESETRQAQDLKLASLGHLTANIAHELRNPLGTVSHAAQLLAESQTLSAEDLNLVKMMKQHCDRMNTVIQNVLSLSGRKPARTQHIALIPWLEQFIKELTVPEVGAPRVTLEADRKDLMVNVDPSQLTQILINLCENGLRYSFKKNGTASLILRVQTTDAPPTVLLDVIDNGEGISNDIAKHIFEPFFTTENNGSGLGLYIAKELSQMNGTRLDYVPNLQFGSQFRLTIPKGEVNA